VRKETPLKKKAVSKGKEHEVKQSAKLERGNQKMKNIF